jgi:pyruvate/2-oxoglutarate/acetoin dehydrogenase E1 component
VSDISYRDAIVDALDEELDRDPSVFLLGQDVGRMGGNFATTRGLYAKYGAERIRDTPISEDAIVGLALGSAIVGLRPVPEIMFSSFLGCCMDELWNHVSQIYYLSIGRCVPRLTLRTVNVFGRSSGGHHSGRPEASLMHLPGLVVLAPSTAFDAKAMLKYAIRSDDPVIFIEQALLYGSEIGPVGGPDDLIPFGSAKILRDGSDITLVAYSGTVRLAMTAAAALNRMGIRAEVLDLRSLAPLDDAAILQSVGKTGRLIVVEEDVRTCGTGAEVISRVSENAWDSLVAPPARIAAADVPIPFSPALEEAIGPTARAVVETALRLCGSAT